MKTNNELIDEFVSLSNDTDKWKWIMKNKSNKDISIVLDNCCEASVKMSDNDNNKITVGCFDESYDNEDSEGISCLLNAMGINWEYFEFGK